MRRLIILAICLSAIISAVAQNVTIEAKERPASEVFSELMKQTGKNFVYSADLLDGMTVTVFARKKPLKQVLRDMFSGTGIEYKVKGNDVLLKRSQRKVAARPLPKTDRDTALPALTSEPLLLEEVVVVSRLEAPAVETAEMGARKLTAEEIIRTPVLFGEADVIKALQMQPGVSDGMEGLAGMHVHGGNSDQNLYMLDNIPLYQVNHFGGLFSAFNVDAIRYIDFFKSSVPAKYDGRLSSFLDVRTSNGRQDGHHGSAKLGLTSGAFNIGGPIGNRTTYNIALRRSWYEALTAPFIALINSGEDDKIRFRYAFMDFNAKINHRFTDRTSAYVSVYFGNDELHAGDLSRSDYDPLNYNDKYDFNWGNFVTQTGVFHRITDRMTGEFTAAYTRYFSNLEKHESTEMKYGDEIESVNYSEMKTDNDITDWIARADFNWNPYEKSHIRFGASYTLHSFLPSRTWRKSTVDDTTIESRDSVRSYLASEINTYIENDMKINERFHINAGIHVSMFHIDRKSRFGISPRLSASYRIAENLAIKGAYTRTVQYVHLLAQSYLSLPTDQWIPITGDLKPETADKVAAGVYWQSSDSRWAASAEGYLKQMHNLVDYRDEYYLLPLFDMWNARLTKGRGSAKGIDFKFEKTSGSLTGHIAYSLAWSDRTFAEKNGGRTFPARFDNRHTINIMLNWKISRKVDFNAAWTGHSGNRFTLLAQSWETPDMGLAYNGGEAPLRAPINNYQLPFYHRLDLGIKVRNSHGYWTFGLYNAYCHLNTVAIRRNEKEIIMVQPNWVTYVSRPVFQKVCLFPIIPSISYTWQF